MLPEMAGRVVVVGTLLTLHPDREQQTKGMTGVLAVQDLPTLGQEAEVRGQLVVIGTQAKAVMVGLMMTDGWLTITSAPMEMDTLLEVEVEVEIATAVLLAVVVAVKEAMPTQGLMVQQTPVEEEEEEERITGTAILHTTEVTEVRAI